MGGTYIGGRSVSIDEGHEFFGSRLIGPVDISELLGQQFLLDPDPAEDYRDQAQHD